MPTTAPLPVRPSIEHKVRSVSRSNGTGTASPSRRATIEDLYSVEGKAEIVNGRIVRFTATGKKPKYAGDAVLVSLWFFVRRQRLSGSAVGDNGGFRVQLSNRESFSPDAAYFEGLDSGMKFFEGAPRFAVEVRSENDYGSAPETEMRDKRADYFAAGTLAVWDVDLLNEPIVRLYTNDNADTPIATFTRGEIAHAGEAVPEWAMPVDDLFEP